MRTTKHGDGLYEVHRCCNGDPELPVATGDEGGVCDEPECEAKHYWFVGEHQVSGGIACIADCACEADAHAIALALENFNPTPEKLDLESSKARGNRK